MTNANNLGTGVYRHRGGGLYRLLFVARDSQNGPGEGQGLVVYVSLTTGNVCVRTLAEWSEPVDWPAFAADVEGHERLFPAEKRPRFIAWPAPEVPGS